ncbi:MAG: NFACT RNA binding domain-containing protein [bacterium]|nr:NFACT RNA binding domain-containing protein [bacterium]
MALDGIFLHHMVSQLKSTLKDSRVSQIYQPNRDELTMIFRTFDGNKRLLISARANSPRINLCSSSPENPPTPTMLCMLLRKRLSGAKLLDISQPSLERIVFLDFESVNELGDRVNLRLAVEIMGKYSNVILIDGRGVIIDALKRVDLSMSSQRLVLPNVKYELPPPQDKLNILCSEPEEIISRATKILGEMPLNKALLNSLQGISPIIARELEYKCADGVQISNKELGTTQKLALFNALENLKAIADASSGTPCMVTRAEESKPFDISFIPVKQYGKNAEVKEFESFSALLEAFYDKRDNADRMKIKSQDLHKLISNLTERLSRKINIQSAELKKCRNRDELRIKGDLLQANLYRIPRGASSITAENFYDDNKEITISLNPALSPSANVQKYYKNYRKAKTAEKMLTEQIENAKQELQYIASVGDLLERAESEKELAQIRLELTEQGYIKAPKGKQKKPSALPPLEYLTTDGFRVLVGRNNKQNDALTLKTASKKDIWFHTKDIHGSHTILITDGKEPTQTAVTQAAEIAAYHSKAKESSKVPVDYTAVKNVSKPKGAKPGMVIYLTNKTAYVTPKIPKQNN